MKKLAIASLIALTTTAASAMNVGITTARDYSGRVDRDSVGFTLGEKFGRVGVTGGFERFTNGSNDQDRFSLVLGTNMAKFGRATFTPKIGVAYLDNQRGHDGYAMTVGAGVTVPVTKRVNLGLDFAHQIGQDRIAQFDGNRFGLGLNFKF